MRDVPLWIGAVASLSVHLCVATWIWRLPSAEASARAVTIEWWRPTERSSVAAPDGRADRIAEARPVPPSPGGPRDPENVDAFDLGGGGDVRGPLRATRLVTTTDRVLLQDATMNAVRVSQIQRIRTARDRASREDRRATPRPMELLFLATGDGPHPERRTPAAVDAQAGARTAPRPSQANAEPSRVRAEGDATRAERPATDSPSDAIASDARRSPDRGVSSGRGRSRTEAARVATGRPPVDRGPAATPTNWTNDRVRDNQDAELLAAQLQQSLLDATPHAGRIEGAGVGGSGGGGPAGIGGDVAEGGRTRAWTSAPGEFSSRDPSDAQYRRWLLDLRGRVTRVLRFPQARRLAMDQGTSVYRVLLRRDGSVQVGPSLLRSSGFADLDEAARVAIVQSLPVPPIPEDVARGLGVIAVTLPVQFVNPMFR